MRVDAFDFDLPPENIALRPARPRDAARLLLVEGARDAALRLSDKSVRDLPALLRHLRAQGIKLRDCASFGLPGVVRLGVLAPVAQEALRAAVRSHASAW